MKKHILPALLISFCFGCTNSSQLDSAEWLIGTWENSMSQRIIYEEWKKIDKESLSGRSFYLNNSDTIVLETVALKEAEEGLVYSPTVKNQNNGQAVNFTMTECSSTSMKFENQAHDFPQIIEYRLIKNDSLVAEISGKVNGEMRRQRFAMSKIK